GRNSRPLSSRRRAWVPRNMAPPPRTARGATAPHGAPLYSTPPHRQLGKHLSIAVTLRKFAGQRGGAKWGAGRGRAPRTPSRRAPRGGLSRGGQGRGGGWKWGTGGKGRSASRGAVMVILVEHNG